MKRLMILLTIRMVVRNTDEAIKIYNTIFSEQKVKKSPVVLSGTTKSPITQIVSKPSSKKEELMESLDYLKNKKVKTKKDKDSIGMLEAILKNMA